MLETEFIAEQSIHFVMTLCQLPVLGTEFIAEQSIHVLMTVSATGVPLQFIVFFTKVHVNLSVVQPAEQSIHVLMTLCQLCHYNLCLWLLMLPQ